MPMIGRPLASVTWEEGNPPILIHSVRELDDLLNGIESLVRTDHPVIVLVDRGELGCMDIRLGLDVSALHHVQKDQMPPYMVTVGDQSAQGEIDFYYFGDHTPLPRRWAIANSDARAGITWWLEHGSLAPFLTWEEV